MSIQTISLSEFHYFKLSVDSACTLARYIVGALPYALLAFQLTFMNCQLPFMCSVKIGCHSYIDISHFVVFFTSNAHISRFIS